MLVEARVLDGQDGVEIVERYEGTGSTDFWGISFASSALDSSAMEPEVLEQRLGLLWAGRAPRWVYQGGAEGARSLLEAITGSLITVTGVIFSVTIVALQLAS